MKVNDRGTKKWVSIMMPEQIEGLRLMWEEMDHKEKPILDEQQLQENEFKLRAALRAKIEVRVTYFVDHDFHTVEGMITNINNKIIYIEEMELNFDDVQDDGDCRKIRRSARI